MKQLVNIFSAAVLGAALLTGCKTYNDEEIQQFDNTIAAYVKRNKIDSLEQSSSGLYYRILEEGSGDPILHTDVVSFTYTGKLLDGTVFDKQDEPVEYKVSDLIGAWQEIMNYLRPGGKAYLIAPPQLGYGDRELDDIPQNSILQFEMKIVAVK